MPPLLELQRSFRTALLADDEASPPACIVADRIGAGARLAVYRNNVIGALTRALQLSYPAVERLVGDDFFAAAAQRFIVAFPPKLADLNQYGESFPAFLASFEAAAGIPYLPDVASLEWAVSRALHAPPALSLAPAALADVPAESQAALCFKPHATLSLLALSYPARAIWEAVLCEDGKERADRLAAIDIEAGGEALGVLRRDGEIDVVALSDPAFAFVRSLADGRPLSEALDPIEPDEAAHLLANLLRRGFFADFSLLPESELKNGWTS